jgi:hypothetical protein
MTRLRLLAASRMPIRLAIALDDGVAKCSPPELTPEVELADSFPKGAVRVWVASARTGARYRLGMTELANVHHGRLAERAPDRASRANAPTATAP